MKKYYIIFIILVVVMAIVFYIIGRNKEVISEEEINSSNNISFEYRVTNMKESITYKVIINENKKLIEKYRFNDELIFSSELDSDDIKNIKKTLIIGKVNRWDGFDKADPYILDGEMFDFSAKIDDAKIYASGSNSFPRGYREFKDNLNEIVKKYDIIKE